MQIIFIIIIAVLLLQIIREVGDTLIEDIEDKKKR